MGLLLADRGHEPAPPLPSRPPSPPGRPGLALGITEGNPFLIRPGRVPPAFAPWRDKVAALHPRSLRILVDWSQVQPAPGAPPQWDNPETGCVRTVGPCAPFNGIRDELRAASAAGIVPVFVLYGTPSWAATAPAAGCLPRGSTAFSRPPDVAAYQRLVGSLLALVRAEGVRLAYWSPWNEPNHPAFLAPQRAACDPASPPLAPAIYAQLAQAMRVVLAGGPGQRMLAGELAGYDRPRAEAAGAAEFASALPAAVVCHAAAWAQHGYVRTHGRLAADPAAAGTLQAVEAALDAKGCDDPPPVWITETGIGGDRGCPAMATSLAAWRQDPRVAAAFQYTFRDDPAFPVGLADAGLTRVHPSYAAWAGAPCAARTRSGARRAVGPAPPPRTRSSSAGRGSRDDVPRLRAAPAERAGLRSAPPDLG